MFAPLPTIFFVMAKHINVILFDAEDTHNNLLPLSFTRPVSDFRVGIVTIREKWEAMMPGCYSALPVEYLREKFAPMYDDESIFVEGAVLPTPSLVEAVSGLGHGQALVKEGRVIAARGARRDFEKGEFSEIEYHGDVKAVRFPFDVFLMNGEAICDDYARLVAGRESQPLPPHCTLIGDPLLEDGTPSLFIEEGAVLLGCSINVTGGPVYIGRDAVVMEGAALRGPLAVCDNAKVRMGAKVYGASTFGPYCKVGGEVDNVVLFAYSNKAHDGYLGNAVIGEWCNIGAGVNASNLKNDYSKVRVWNYPTHSFMRTDLQFCGLIMADHSKAGINCMFNTATVLGVGVNIHGAGFPRTFIPSFLEGSPVAGMKDVPLKKFYQIAERVMSRRDITLTDLDKRIYERIFEIASSYK